MKTIKSFYIYIPLALMLVVILTFVFKDFVQNKVAGPFTNTVSVVVGLINSIPEYWTWTFLLVVILFIAIRSFDTNNVQISNQVEPILKHPKRERVDFWIVQLHYLRSDYGQLRPFDFLGKLILNVVAYHEQLSQADTDQKIENRELIVPDDVRIYLSKIRNQTHHKRTGFFSNFWNRIRSVSILNLFHPSQPNQNGKETDHYSKTHLPNDNNYSEIESVLNYLEEQLKIPKT